MTPILSLQHPTIKLAIRAFSDDRRHTVSSLRAELGLSRTYGHRILRWLHGRHFICIVDYIPSLRGEPTRIFSLGKVDTPYVKKTSLELKKKYRAKRTNLDLIMRSSV